MTAIEHDRTQVRHKMLGKWTFLGFAAVADSVGAGGYIDDDSEFKHERYGPNEFADRWVHRYELTDDQRARLALDMDTSTGRLNVDGTYGNTTSLLYEVLGLHPDIINDAIQRGQEKQVDRLILPFGTFVDSDMELLDEDYYDGTLGGSAASDCTVAKDTAEGNVYSGTQSLFINLSGAGGYCRFQRVRVPSKRRVTVSLIVRTTGTMTLRVYNASAGGYIANASRSYSGEDFGFVTLSFTTPAGCEVIQIEVAGSGATDDIWVDGVFGPYVAGRRRFELPEHLANAYQVRYVRVSQFKAQLEAGISDAHSRQWIGDWEQPTDFTMEVSPRAANPFHLTFSEEITDDELARPLWLVAERPLSDVEPLDSETARTTAPIEQVVAYAMAELAEVIRDRNPDKPEYARLYAETRVSAAVERLARPPHAKVKERVRRRLRA